MTTCTNCGTELDSETIDPDIPQAAFCSEDCIKEFGDSLPEYVAPVIFPKE